MARKRIFVCSDNKKAVEFLAHFFSDTESIPTIVRSKNDFATVFSEKPDIVFVQGEWIDRRAGEKIQQLKTKDPGCKFFQLGHLASPVYKTDAEIELPIDDKLFRRVLLSRLDYPETIKVLVVDDEAAVAEAVKDYFEFRTKPAFKITTAANGLEGFKRIEEDNPDCLILDIKMPVRNGVELYKDINRSGRKIPTIVYIDSTAAEEILEIRRWGTPIFVEKGGDCSSMPDIMSLVKKLVFFC